MATNTDSALDVELANMKRKIEEIKKLQIILGNTFQTIPPKEKAKLIQQIDSTTRAVAQFIVQIKINEVFNSGTKFSIENLKQSLNMAQNQWKVILRKLE